MTKDIATDRALGARVRLARIETKISQTALGNHLGISFQQVQKYELGKDRISASTLSKIAKILSQPISYFFEDLEAQDAAAPRLADIVDRRGRAAGATRQDIDILLMLQRVPDAVKRRFEALLKVVAAPAVDVEAPAPLPQAAE